MSSHGKPRDAKRRSSVRIFLSYPHTHDRFLYYDILDDQEVNLSILEEAAAIQTVCTMEQLSSQGQSTTIESVTVALLADLQDEQDKELGTTLRAVENMVRH